MVRSASRAGFTLVEMLIGTILMVMAAFAASMLMTAKQKESIETQKRIELKNRSGAVAAHLQKFINSGDIRFYGHTGNFGVPDESASRMLLSLPCKERETSLVLHDSAVAPGISYGNPAPTGDFCDRNNSFAYIHYDKTTTPAVTAICGFKLTAGPPDTTHVELIRVLVDMNNVTYGPPSFDGASSTFTIPPAAAGSLGNWPAGKIDVSPNSVVALMNPPQASLWIVRSVTLVNPSGVTALPATAPPVISGAPSALYDFAACSSQMVAGSAGYGVLPAPAGAMSFVQLGLEPLFVDNLFNTSAALSGIKYDAQSVVGSAFGQFPMRLFNTSFRVFGRNDADHSFGLRQCVVKVTAAGTNPSATNLDCTLAGGAKDLFTVPDVKSVQMLEKFKLKLGANLPEELYQVTPTSLPLASPTLCLSSATPKCHFFPLSPLTAQRNPGEGLDNLLDETQPFSQLKHDLLGSLRVNLTSETGTNEVFDVYFP